MNVFANPDLKEKIAKRKNVSMTVPDMGFVKIINVFALTAFLERIVHCMNVQITARNMVRVNVKQVYVHAIKAIMEKIAVK